MTAPIGTGASRVCRSWRASYKPATLILAALMAACQAREVVEISKFPGQGRHVAESITIVSWNAEKGASPQFTGDLVNLIVTNRPDFVFLQEARVDLVKTGRIGGHFAASWRYPWPDGKTIGLLTLSQVPPLRLQPMPSEHKEFFITAPKLSLVTEYPLADGERLMTVNVHILAFERFQTVGIRAQLEDLEAVMAAHTGPIVFTGDFNTWSHKRLDVLEGIVDALGLTEVEDFPPGRRLGDKSNSFLNWLFGIDEGLPLDRVYYRGFTHHSAKVLSYDSSDHRAIQVTLELEPQRPASTNQKNHGGFP